MMRLFVSVNFDNDTVEHLYKGAETLRQNSISANISRRENLHLTLAFIGEVPSTKQAIDALNSVEASAFSLILKGYGEFGNGNVCFAKTEKCKELLSLADMVRSSLISRNLHIDTKPFRPHVTLARQLIPCEDFDKKVMDNVLCRKNVKVDRISLMRSDRIKGKLTYTELFSKNLT